MKKLIFIALLFGLGIFHAQAQGYLGRKFLIAYKPSIAYLAGRGSSSVVQWINHGVELEYIKHRRTSFGLTAIYMGFDDKIDQWTASTVGVFARYHVSRHLNPIGNYTKLGLLYTMAEQTMGDVIDNNKASYNFLTFQLGFGRRVPISRRLLFDYSFQMPILLGVPAAEAATMRHFNIQFGLTFAIK